MSQVQPYTQEQLETMDWLFSQAERPSEGGFLFKGLFKMAGGPIAEGELVVLETGGRFGRRIEVGGLFSDSPYLPLFGIAQSAAADNEPFDVLVGAGTVDLSYVMPAIPSFSAPHVFIDCVDGTGNYDPGDVHSLNAILFDVRRVTTYDMPVAAGSFKIRIGIWTGRDKLIRMLPIPEWYYCEEQNQQYTSFNNPINFSSLAKAMLGNRVFEDALNSYVSGSRFTGMVTNNFDFLDSLAQNNNFSARLAQNNGFWSSAFAGGNAIDIVTQALLSNSIFYNGLAAYKLFTDALVANTDFMDALKASLLADATFIADLKAKLG